MILQILGSPDESLPAQDLLAQARSGLVWEHYDDRPLMFNVKLPTYGTVIQGLLALLSALYQRADSNVGCVVHATMLQGALYWLGASWTWAEAPDATFACDMPKNLRIPIVEGSDGKWVVYAGGGPGGTAAVDAALGVVPVPTSDGNADPGETFFGDVNGVAERARTYPSSELLELLVNAGVAAELVREPGECWDEEQLRTNGVISTEPVRRRVRRPPDRLEVSADMPELLSGVRVIDMGHFVAGPLASVILSDLGADVVQLEPLTGDGMRAGLTTSVVASNRGKRSIAVNVKSPEGRQILYRACAWADVVHHNFRPGSAARLKVDAQSLRGQKPELIVLESSAFGPTGPKSELPGYDTIGQAIGGHFTYSSGSGDHAPRKPDLPRRRVYRHARRGRNRRRVALRRRRTGEGASLTTSPSGLVRLLALRARPHAWPGVPRWFAPRSPSAWHRSSRVDLPNRRRLDRAGRGGA